MNTIHDLLFFLRNGSSVKSEEVSDKMRKNIKEFQFLMDCIECSEGSEREQYVDELIELYNKAC